MENNWNVGGIEKLDWVWLSETSDLSAAEGELNSESLEIDDDEHHNDSGEQVHQVWCTLPVKRLLQGKNLVWLGQKEVEKGNNASLEFSSLVSSNGNWGEALPQDGLANVGGDEKGDT